MKLERSSREPEASIKQHLPTKNVKEELATKVTGGIMLVHSEKSGKNDNVTLNQLNDLMGTGSYTDKKFNFTLAIRGNCVDKYEKLATGISYKLDLKTARNTLMRKVLEDFIVTNFTE